MDLDTVEQSVLKLVWLEGHFLKTVLNKVPQLKTETKANHKKKNV